MYAAVQAVMFLLNALKDILRDDVVFVPVEFFSP